MKPWERDWSAPAKPWERDWSQKPQTSLPEQASSGINEGIANMAGLPVDAMTGILNFGARGLGLPEIERPFGGSEMIRGALDPLISETEPQTAGQGLARRVGKEVGAGAVAAPVAGISSLWAAGLNLASDAAAGASGWAAEQLGGNETVQSIAALLGGVGTAGLAHMARPGPQAPSIDDLKRQAGDRYRQVENSPVRLSPDEAQELRGNVSARMYDMRMNPSLHPQAAAAVDEVYQMPMSPALQDVVEARRAAGRATRLPATADNAREVGRLGGGIRSEIDGYLDAIAQRQGAADDVRALQEADALHRRASAAQTLESATRRAQRRAATSGSGGNEINTTRQNIRAILDSPDKSAGFTPAERAQMEEIVMGTPGTNFARMIGGLSPDRGALPLMGNIVGAAASGATMNPIFMAPGMIGFVAKQIGEDLTERQVQKLAATIRNGAPLPGKALTEGERAVFTALMMAGAGNAEMP